MKRKFIILIIMILLCPVTVQADLSESIEKAFCYHELFLTALDVHILVYQKRVEYYQNRLEQLKRRGEKFPQEIDEIQKLCSQAFSSCYLAYYFQGICLFEKACITLKQDERFHLYSKVTECCDKALDAIERGGGAFHFPKETIVCLKAVALAKAGSDKSYVDIFSSLTHSNSLETLASVLWGMGELGVSSREREDVFHRISDLLEKGEKDSFGSLLAIQAHAWETFEKDITKYRSIIELKAPQIQGDLFLDKEDAKSMGKNKIPVLYYTPVILKYKARAYMAASLDKYRSGDKKITKEALVPCLSIFIKLGRKQESMELDANPGGWLGEFQRKVASALVEFCLGKTEKGEMSLKNLYQEARTNQHQDRQVLSLDCFGNTLSLIPELSSWGLESCRQVISILENEQFAQAVEEGKIKVRNFVRKAPWKVPSFEKFYLHLAQALYQNQKYEEAMHYYEYLIPTTLPRQAYQNIPSSILIPMARCFIDSKAFTHCKGYYYNEDILLSRFPEAVQIREALSTLIAGD